MTQQDSEKQQKRHFMKEPIQSNGKMKKRCRWRDRGTDRQQNNEPDCVRDPAGTA